MRRLTVLGPATLVVFVGAVLGAPKREPVFVAPAPRAGAEVRIGDAQEIVVYAPHRPIRVRVTARYEGKAIGDMWRERLRAAFEYFDRDQDGFLSEKEVPNIFSDTGISQMLQNGFYQPTPQDRPSLERLDADKDGRVSFAEFAIYYKASTAQVFRPQLPMAENPYNAATTEALFKLMDADGDGKLTRDEVKAIEKLVATKDADEDECLSISELIPGANDGRLRGRQVQVIQPNGIPYPLPSNNAAKTVVTYETGRIPGTLTQQVIKRYDRDGDFELTRAECNFDEATFARLDGDGNGKLDGEELEEWRTGEPDFEVSLSLASSAADCVAKLVTDVNALTARDFSVKQVEPGRLIVRSGRQPIEFWAFASVIAGYQQPRLKQQYQYLFQQAANGKDYVLEKDLTGPNAVQFQFLRTLFDAADANGDGKMTRTEFDAFFDLQDSFRNIALVVTPAVQTPTLFQLLDENRDGRLGVRELRTAWDRLIALEPGHSDVVTKAAIQPSVSLRLSRGMDRYSVNQIQFDINLQNPNQAVPVPQKGPIWFRRMDRNGDGDISRSEFLGTKAEFDAIDTDHDDLIGLAEAEAYDARMRKKGEGRVEKKPR